MKEIPELADSSTRRRDPRACTPSASEIVRALSDYAWVLGAVPLVNSIVRVCAAAMLERAYPKPDIAIAHVRLGRVVESFRLRRPSEAVTTILSSEGWLRLPRFSVPLDS